MTVACFVGNYNCTQRISKQAKYEVQNVTASLNYCSSMMKDFSNESEAEFSDLM